MNSMSEYASNMLESVPAGYHTGGEIFINRFTFGDLDVTTNQDTVITSVGSGAVRLSYFRYDSNTAGRVPFIQQVSTALGGMPVTGVMHGQALDLSYAQPVGHQGTIIGVSYLPVDTSTIRLMTPALGVISDGRTEAQNGVRVGILQKLPYGLRVGANYSYQIGSSTATFLTPTSPTPVTQSAHYLTRKVDLGIAAHATPRAQCFAGYSNTLATGGSLNSFSGEDVTIGMRYAFSPALTTQVSSTGTNHSLSVGWTTRYGIFSVAYGQHPLGSASQYLGNGHAIAAMYDLAL